MPVLEQLSDLCVSVDTRRPAVMKAALAAGASMINDVDALSAPGALEAVAESDCGVCLMHKKGEPPTMQKDPHYDDVVAEVKAFLQQRVDAALAAGIAAGRIVVDPGFGFGKTMEHNLELLRHLPGLAELPVLAGLSRKSMLAKLTGRGIDERLAGSLTLALLALQGGATILRVHDVKETRDVIAVWQAFEGESKAT
jgi:dihydropteroate synthase